MQTTEASDERGRAAGPGSGGTPALGSGDRALASSHAAAGSADRERGVVVALQAGDERVFAELVQRHTAAMLRVAQLYVPSRAVAEEVVQETWLGVIEGIGRFRGDSSLRTWIFRILTNRAKTRGERERRSRPFSTLETDAGEHAPPVEPERFMDTGQTAGHWITPPGAWDGAPEERLLSAETRGRLRAAVDALPARQRAVITLRDVHGWTAEEVREALDLSEGNQRVLLHRARSAVRHTLEHYLAGG